MVTGRRKKHELILQQQQKNLGLIANVGEAVGLTVEVLDGVSRGKLVLIGSNDEKLTLHSYKKSMLQLGIKRYEIYDHQTHDSIGS